jgi:hypothetical protein
MAWLKLRRLFQLTLSAQLRKQFHLAEGDSLEAEAAEAGILLEPVRMVERKKPWGGMGKVRGCVQATLAPQQQRPQAQEELRPPIIKDERPRRG